ncbi:ABC-F type ribosomal protection protein [Vagococcus penaei]|uniref:ABC-F type ribosomal protection protein n=1 Tax=Vagococcus penaei TaxID=633807 RepID=A0A1Q2D7M0_9ENTE|nr:ABC-F type ribosomal protection protein [Vagococcus penaei]AQP54359.1 ABC-F type ribosomal protection protein [Vagococcus penaei]RSU06275.1 ABC-F type ribosomal protection protein [Vagococcus penaei]
MSKIDINKLSFQYDGAPDLLFDDVTLTIDASWKLGLIGRNGRGKSTFLNLLMNKLEYNGQVQHQLPFTYFPMTIDDPTKMTYDLLTDLSTVELWEIERELTLLGTTGDCLWRPFDTLSGGEQTKVLLALLFADKSAFPLIDEPTNHLDLLGRQQVARYLKNKQQGFIVTSHDQQFIDSVVDHILSLDKSKIVLYQGNYTTYLEQKKLEDQTERHQNDILKKDIARLKETATKKAEWSQSREKDKYGSSHIKNSGSVGDTGYIGARAAKMMKKSKNLLNRMDQQITEKSALLKNIETADSLTMNYQPDHHANILRLENLQLSFDQQPLFDPITIDINQGDRVAIIGPNGSGKSSLIEAILGQFSGQMTGIIHHATNQDWSTIRQLYSDNLGDLQEFCEKHHLSYEQLLANLRKLGIERNLFVNPIERMSMGQQKKVEVAKSLITPAQFYLWDEPLNYLDLFNHQQLEDVILRDKPTLLFVDHNQAFIDRIATKIIDLSH